VRRPRCWLECRRDHLERRTAGIGRETHRCAQFLFREAALLDGGDHAGWLKLLAPDVVYWVPLLSDYRGPEDELNIVYDDLSKINDRLERLSGGYAFAKIRPRAPRALSGTCALGATATASRRSRPSCCTNCGPKRRRYKRSPAAICMSCKLMTATLLS